MSADLETEKKHMNYDGGTKLGRVDMRGKSN